MSCVSPGHGWRLPSWSSEGIEVPRGPILTQTMGLGLFKGRSQNGFSLRRVCKVQTKLI